MNISQRIRLAAEIDSAIHGIQWPANAQEPDYVANLVTTLPKVLKTSLQSLLPQRQINVGGAFIHQKPIVRFINPPRPGLRNPEG